MPQEEKTEGPQSPQKTPAFKENVIRLMTVFAYASSVSMAALVLSSYYVFFWEPKPPGPGPPVIHPHAYVADPYPPLKLVGLPPEGHDADAEGASFWQSVWSYFHPEDTTTTLTPKAKITTKPMYLPNPKRYSSMTSTVTPEPINENSSFSHLTPILVPDYSTILPENKTSQSDEKIGIVKAADLVRQGYAGIIPDRNKRGVGNMIKTKANEKQSNKNKMEFTTYDTNMGKTTKKYYRNYTSIEYTETNKTTDKRSVEILKHNGSKEKMTTEDEKLIPETKNKIVRRSRDEDTTKPVEMEDDNTPTRTPLDKTVEILGNIAIDQSARKLIDQPITVMNRETDASATSDKTTNTIVDHSVFKETDLDTTINQTDKPFTTELGTQYQHHMRQLKPRRKFPSQ